MEELNREKFLELCDNFPNLDNIQFISESNLDPSRKTYLYNGLIIKVHEKKEDLTQYLRQNDLKQEYELLLRCNGIDGIPRGVSYCSNDQYDFLLVSFLDGVQLVNLKLSFVQFIKLMKDLSKILFNISRKGISHNDIVPENVLVTSDFNVSLIDFDQATKTKPFIAILRQFLGINIGESKLNYSIITIIKEFIRKKFPKAIYRLKKFLGQKPVQIEKLLVLDEAADPKLKSLLKAWKLAQKSNASSPGIPIAYYTLEYEGVTFPGERPWIRRWNELKNISDYSGKKIIELGCNMGLLSVSLLKDAGAVQCLGVDHDKTILESAEIISGVFNVNPTFRQVNFDSKKNWEDELLSFNADIIFALNVLNWITDKERFLRFLSHFNEVIFEGHDLPEEEKNRFKKLGFSTIEEIGFSERERIILRCRK